MQIARLKKTGLWIGLVAIALQIAFAPALSMRALAMELDPLAAAQICGGDGSKGPAGHAGHCTDCCVAACAAQVMPVLAPVSLSLPLPKRQAEPLSAVPQHHWARGPPRLDFPARGPPFLV